MNDYITLDGKKYKTSHKAWKIVNDKPSTVRITVVGTLDVTYGSRALTGYEGIIIANVTPDSGYGSYLDLKATIEKVVPVSFTEHDGTIHSSSHVIGQSNFESLSPNWGGTYNKFYISVKIIY